MNIEKRIANTKDQTELRHLLLKDLVENYEFEEVMTTYNRIYEQMPSYRDEVEDYNFKMREKHKKVYYTVKNILEKEE